MSFNILPETESIVEVFLRPHFAISFASSNIITMLSLFFLEKHQLNGKDTTLFVYPNLFANVISLTIFLSAMTYTKSLEITRAVATGRIPPLKLSRLRSLPFPFDVLCGKNGDRKMVEFVMHMAAFPGVFVSILLHLLCFLVHRKLTFEWEMPVYLYLAMTSVWRLFVAAIIFAVNYVAALNPTQSVLQPTPDSDSAAAPAEEENAKTK